MAETETTAVVTEAARPEWLPETHWDAGAKAPKLDALAKDYGELGTLRTFKTDADAKAAAIPKAPGEYKTGLPETVKLPEGLQWKPDPKDPVLGRFTGLAHKHGLSQDAVTAMLGLWAEINGEGYSAEQAAAAEAGKQAKTAEENAARELRSSLGDGAAGRITGAATWLGASFSKDQTEALAPLLKSRHGVEAVELMIEMLKGVQMRGTAGGNGKTLPKSAAQLLYGGAAAN